jgi:hypothetical protein
MELKYVLLAHEKIRREKYERHGADGLGFYVFLLFHRTGKQFCHGQFCYAKIDVYVSYQQEKRGGIASV